MNKDIKRGQVWFYRPSVERPGHIQKGPRPVIIVSNDMMNQHSSIVLAVPCTTQIKRNYPTHSMFIMNNQVSVALAEQAGPVCVNELVECKTTLPKYIMDSIDNALSVAYGLKPMPVIEVPQVNKPQPNKPKPVEPAPTAAKKRIKWTYTRMKRFLSDFASLKSADRVADKYGLSVSTATTYKSKFETLVEPQGER